MINFGRGALAVALALLWAAATAAAQPAGTAPADGQPGMLTIGYLALAHDARYDDKLAYGGLLVAPGGRPLAGAELGLGEAVATGALLHRGFALQSVTAADAAGLVAAMGEMQRQGIAFFLLDAPDAVVTEVAKAVRDQPVLLFNISAEGDGLRGATCQRNLLNVAPSLAMLTDAMAQFLTARKWQRVLELVGPLPADAAYADAFARAARRFGVKIVDRRAFMVGNDPRARDRNNLALLTGSADYDVVLVADSDGEFGRGLPYQTQKPRPVVGTAGLVAQGWSWAWERHGGPQLSRRFFRRAKRQMQTADWAAWAAVKLIAGAALTRGSDDFAAIAAAITDANLRFDGFKGPPLSFRPWDNQLRQPIMLADAEAVVATAPLPGFLHQKNDLDTLGFDQPETACRF